MPSIGVNPAFLTNLNATLGSFGPSTNFTASASNLTNDITVTANDAVNFAISTNNTDLTNTLTLATSSTGGLPNTPVYVRLTGAAKGAQSNTVSLVSGSVSTNVIVTGTVANSNAPSLSVNPTNLTDFVTTAGTASVAQTFAVNSTNLQADVIVTSPSGYQVSLDGSTWSSNVVVPFASYNAYNDFYLSPGAAGFRKPARSPRWRRRGSFPWRRMTARGLSSLPPRRMFHSMRPTRSSRNRFAPFTKPGIAMWSPKFRQSAME